MILSGLTRYYDRLEKRGDVVRPGWSIEPIGFQIVLDAQGNIVEVVRRADLKGKKPQPMAVPKWFGRSGSGSTPFFLWDNTGYALGVSRKPGDKVVRDHAAFRALHLAQLTATDDPSLAALRRFIEQWRPERFAADARFDPELLDLNLIFLVESADFEAHRVFDLPAAHVLIERLRHREAADEVQCLVTGETGPAVTLHPKIKGVDGTAVAEVPLVSFNKPAFEHYGMAQGRNAPTAQSSAFRYGAALNKLLDRETGRRISIADATVTWWADASGPSAESSEKLFGEWVDPTSAELNVEHKTRQAIQAIGAGRSPDEAVRQVLDAEVKVPFFVLGLAPNAARIVVRYWWQGEFGAVVAHLAQHYADINVQPAPWGQRPPSPQRLLMRTVVPSNSNRPFDYLKRDGGHVSGELLRAMLSGAPYPRSLLVSAVMRLRAGDDPASGWHAAVIKACIARMKDQEGLPVKRDIHNRHESYQLGRLFAVLEAAQRAALGSVNATVTERFYAAASANPARVFGTLLRGARVHVADANRRGRGLWLNRRLDEIIGRIGSFPTSMGIEDQGRFALGYYHERAWRAPRADSADEVADSDDEGQAE